MSQPKTLSDVTAEFHNLQRMQANLLQSMIEEIIRLNGLVPQPEQKIPAEQDKKADPVNP